MRIQIIYRDLIEIVGSQDVSLDCVRGFNRLVILLLDIKKLLIIVFLLLFA